MLRTNLLATINHLNWQAIGPGPDPAVALDAITQFNGTPFRFRAVRVFAPYSAGWTQNDSWELEPADLTDDIAWDVDLLRRWVRFCDQLPEQAETPPQPEPHYTRDMLEFEDWWTTALDLFFWDDADYAPVLINGLPYQVIGYPAATDAPGAPAITLPAITLPETGWGNDTGEPGFRDGIIRLLDKPFRLYGYDMLGIHGRHQVRHRPINRKDADYLRHLEDFLTAEVTGGTLRTTPVAGSHCMLFVQPLLTTAFRIVPEQRMQPPGNGQMRWHFPQVDAETAAVTEAVGRMIRARRMAFHENRPIVVGTAEELSTWLPAFVHPSRVLPALRKASTLAAFALGCEHCNAEHDEPIFQDASGVGGIFYIEPSAVGLRLLDHLEDNQLLQLLCQEEELVTPALPENLPFPDWVSKLPRLFDKQYRALWNSMEDYD